MLAFAGPSSKSVDEHGFRSWTPKDYAPLFLNSSIALVIRLNKSSYNAKLFIEAGLRHVDLYFPDGSCPPPQIVNSFLNITEREHGRIAVHCKAGLGRTGTLIGLYAMKHYQFTAREFIAWSRICRPGCVLGPQQAWLVAMESVMFQQGAMMRVPKSPLAMREEGESFVLAEMARLGLLGQRRVEDVGQGEMLCEAKQKQRTSPKDNAEEDQHGCALECELQKISILSPALTSARRAR